MDRVHPKGSKCSSGSLPTQTIVSQVTRGKARTGRDTTSQGDTRDELQNHLLKQNQREFT